MLPVKTTVDRSGSSSDGLKYSASTPLGTTQAGFSGNGARITSRSAWDVNTAPSQCRHALTSSQRTFAASMYPNAFRSGEVSTSASRLSKRYSMLCSSSTNGIPEADRVMAIWLDSTWTRSNDRSESRRLNAASIDADRRPPTWYDREESSEVAWARRLERLAPGWGTN